MTSLPIKQFYNRIKFPGLYDMQGLAYHMPTIRNPYLNIIDLHITGKQNVLDIGCGSGVISNLFGMRHPNNKITAIDFADSIEYAEHFADLHGINNIHYTKQDFLNFNTTETFDCIICQGVLHHIPETQQAVDKIMQLLSPGGTLILGVYHPIGKMLKTVINLDYATQVLYQDQECNPFELSFTKKAVTKLVKPLVLKDQWPKNIIGHAITHPLAFSQSGGIVAYVFQKSVL
jgi:2-polyprenyl-3-methyl-5-hydroxy-6-metoxy-1,4-benzoquinol methylase